MNKNLKQGSGVKSDISPADGKPPVITRLENLNVGDTYKYNLNDVGIFKVLGRQDENWIKTVRTQSGRITGGFPWTEVYPVNVL